MFINRPQTLKTFNQLSLFNPTRFLEIMTSITHKGAFSLELESGATDLREAHWIGDREVHTRAQYSLNQGRLEVGEALFETGITGVSDKEVEDLPYFESLVLKTYAPIALKSGETMPVLTIKVLLTQPPYSPQNLFSKRTDRTRIIGNFGWMRTYEIRDLLPTSDLVNARYADKIKLTETFNHRKPVA